MDDPDVILRRPTQTPIVMPSTQWFGSGFGQNGSTSKRGACTPSACASALSCKALCPTPSARTPVANAAATAKLRLCFTMA